MIQASLSRFRRAWVLYTNPPLSDSPSQKNTTSGTGATGPMGRNDEWASGDSFRTRSTSRLTGEALWRLNVGAERPP